MGFEQPSSIVFSIKEAVWLQRGKEIAEMYSLALEPDISISEEEDHVFIRGNLHLFGEFLPKDKETDYRSNQNEQVSFRSVEEVMLTDDGVGTIRHSFPLDVTIPKERVTNLEDVYVTVDSFDYNLPGNGCIELEASVTVSGIQDVRAEEDLSEMDDVGGDVTDLVVEEEESNGFSKSEKEEERTFHFEQYRQQETEEEQRVGGEEINNDREVGESIEDISSFETSSRENRSVSVDEESSVQSDLEYREDTNGQWNDEKQHDEDINTRRDSSLLEEERDERDDNELDVVLSDLGENKETEEKRKSFQPTVHFISQKQLTDNFAMEEDNDEMYDEGDNDVDHSAKDEENALYLTKMLTKGEEEFSRLKLCIVQAGETLETIAERYGLPVSQLVRVNQLSEEHVEEGQILYIPTQNPPTSQM